MSCLFIMSCWFMYGSYHVFHDMLVHDFPCHGGLFSCHDMLVHDCSCHVFFHDMLVHMPTLGVFSRVSACLSPTGIIIMWIYSGYLLCLMTAYDQVGPKSVRKSQLPEHLYTPGKKSLKKRNLLYLKLQSPVLVPQSPALVLQRLQHHPLFLHNWLLQRRLLKHQCRKQQWPQFLGLLSMWLSVRSPVQHTRSNGICSPGLQLDLEQLSFQKSAGCFPETSRRSFKRYACWWRMVTICRQQKQVWWSRSNTKLRQLLAVAWWLLPKCSKKGAQRDLSANIFNIVGFVFNSGFVLAISFFFSQGWRSLPVWPGEVWMIQTVHMIRQAGDTGVTLVVMRPRKIQRVPHWIFKPILPPGRVWLDWQFRLHSLCCSCLPRILWQRWGSNCNKHNQQLLQLKLLLLQLQSDPLWQINLFLFFQVFLFAVLSIALKSGGQAKQKAKPAPKALPLSDPNLAGKTLAEKVDLARLTLGFSWLCQCFQQFFCNIFFVLNVSCAKAVNFARNSLPWIAWRWMVASTACPMNTTRVWTLSSRVWQTASKSTELRFSNMFFLSVEWDRYPI